MIVGCCWCLIVIGTILMIRLTQYPIQCFIGRQSVHLRYGKISALRFRLVQSFALSISSTAQAIPPIIKQILSELPSTAATTTTTIPEQEDERIQYLAFHLQSYFFAKQRLPKKLIQEILDLSIQQHRLLPNILSMTRPKLSSTTTTTNPTSIDPIEYGSLTVCGDTHGQFYDFCQIFTEEVGGIPSTKNTFLFNGDIVDRGDMGFEIFLYLLSLKLLSSNCITILRGNHETSEMTDTYGFKNEILLKYDQSILRQFYQLFNSLPVGAVIEEQVFVTHGGISPRTYDLTITQLNQLNRSTASDPGNPLYELLWSDPRENLKGFSFNEARGGGYYFGKNATMAFLSKNKLQWLIRSHECKQHGYEVHHDGRCVTVFSAPNYFNRNKAAVIRFDGKSEPLKGQIIQFNGIKKEYSMFFQ